MPLTPLNPAQAQEVYQWVNALRLQRTSSQIHRDFSDAVNAAKVVHAFLPNAVELHNYQPATSSKNKIDNWQTFNNKVLTKIGIRLQQRDIEELAGSTPGRIESLLYQIKAKIEAMNPYEQVESAPKLQRTPNAQTQSASKKPEYVDFYQEIIEQDRSQMQQSPSAKCSSCEEKDRKIKELEEDVKLLEQKIDKLQQLVRLKDGKNKALEQKIEVLYRK